MNFHRIITVFNILAIKERKNTVVLQNQKIKFLIVNFQNYPILHLHFIYNLFKRHFK